MRRALVGVTLSLTVAIACATPVAPAAMPLAATPAVRPTPFGSSPTASPQTTSIRSLGVSEAIGSHGPVLAIPNATVARIDDLIKASHGRAALVVADAPHGSILHEVAADEVVLAASLYKLGVLLEAERRLDRGSLRSADLITVTQTDQRDGGSYTKTGTVLTIDQALERMITLSDNASALALMRHLGVDAIHATLDREGMPRQRCTVRGSFTTARTVATFFGELSRGGLISGAASGRMLARLARQTVNDRIPAALPPGTVLGHKTGNLGFATHDAGLIKGPGGVPLVLVVLTWGSSEEVGSQLIRDITRAVFEALTRP